MQENNVLAGLVSLTGGNASVNCGPSKTVTILSYLSPEKYVANHSLVVFVAGPHRAPKNLPDKSCANFILLPNSRETRLTEHGKPLKYLCFQAWKIRRSCLQILLVLAFAVAVGSFEAAHAHPEDDFCGPDAGIDPELCRQLSDAMNGTGELAAAFLDEQGNMRTPFDTGLNFMNIGIGHILPGGLDHILFVLALFLSSRRLRSLVIQISTFTVAHTATLGLVAAGVFDPPAHIVEPLIALSIAFVAVENIVFREMSKWRPLIVFGFGLFHGMGFAGFVREVGLPPEQFWSSLIGFNLGVEFGQLSVIALAALLSWPLASVLESSRYSYRQLIVVPCSLVIAFVGIWWAATRSLGV